MLYVCAHIGQWSWGNNYVTTLAEKEKKLNKKETKKLKDNEDLSNNVFLVSLFLCIFKETLKCTNKMNKEKF